MKEQIKMKIEELDAKNMYPWDIFDALMNDEQMGKWIKEVPWGEGYSVVNQMILDVLTKKPQEEINRIMNIANWMAKE